MSQQNSSQQKRPRRRQRPPMARVCVSIDEWIEATGFSRPTTYRWMSDGRLRFVQFGTRMRKIPTSEFERLGLTAS